MDPNQQIQQLQSQISNMQEQLNQVSQTVVKANHAFMNISQQIEQS